MGRSHCWISVKPLNPCEALKARSPESQLLNPELESGMGLGFGLVHDLDTCSNANAYAGLRKQGPNMVVSQIKGGPQYRPPNIIILMMGTPNKGTPHFGKLPYRRPYLWLPHGCGIRNWTPKFSEEYGWIAVKELKLRYYIGETLLFTTYTHYGNLI